VIRRNERTSEEDDPYQSSTHSGSIRVVMKLNFQNVSVNTFSSENRRLATRIKRGICIIPDFTSTRHELIALDCSSRILKLRISSEIKGVHKVLSSRAWIGPEVSEELYLVLGRHPELLLNQPASFVYLLACCHRNRSLSKNYHSLFYRLTKLTEACIRYGTCRNIEGKRTSLFAPS
jgi:hypothetical protein